MFSFSPLLLAAVFGGRTEGEEENLEMEKEKEEVRVVVFGSGKEEEEENVLTETGEVKR